MISTNWGGLIDNTPQPALASAPTDTYIFQNQLKAANFFKKDKRLIFGYAAESPNAGVSDG